MAEWKAHKYSLPTDPRWPDHGFEGFVALTNETGRLVCECVYFSEAEEIASAHNGSASEASAVYTPKAPE